MSTPNDLRKKMAKAPVPLQITNSEKLKLAIDKVMKNKTSKLMKIRLGQAVVSRIQSGKLH